MAKAWGLFWAAFLLGIANAQNFPIDGRMSIPGGGKAAAESLIFFKDLDTSLIFWGSSATLGCPSQSYGDFLNVLKEPASSGPLWEYIVTIGCGPRHVRYYDFNLSFEYVFTWREKKIFLRYTSFHPDNAEREVGDSTEIELDYILDTLSHLGDPPMGMRPGLSKRTWDFPLRDTDWLGRKSGFRPRPGFR